MKYNYQESIKADIRDYWDYMKDDTDFEHFLNKHGYVDKAALYEYLDSELYSKDDITGITSGSYTGDKTEAEENICGNWDLLREAIREFGDYTAVDIINKGPECADVTIRCYLFSECLWDVIDDIAWEIQETLEEEEEEEE